MDRRMDRSRERATHIEEIILKYSLALVNAVWLNHHDDDDDHIAELCK